MGTSGVIVERRRGGRRHALRRSAAALLSIATLVACQGSGSTPGPSADASGASTDSPSPTAPSSPTAEGRLSIAWTPVGAPPVRSHGGFEHVFLASERGAMIMIRNLEGAPTTGVATTSDGMAWDVLEALSTSVPFGYSVDGAADWLQVVPRADGRPGLELVASADGRAWETRGRLPDAMAAPREHAVNGSMLLVCAGGRGDNESQNLCALSRDSGRTWEPLAELSSLVGPSEIRGLVALGDGFAAFLEGQRENEAILLTSPDGSSWSPNPEPVADVYSTAAINGTLVVTTMPADPSGPAFSVSRDGTAWETVALPPTESTWFSLVAAGDALVAVGIAVEPEGSEYVTDILVSGDGRTWRADSVPAPMHDWRSTTFLPVVGGLVANDGMSDAMVVGRPIPADDAAPTPVPAGG